MGASERAAPQEWEPCSRGVPLHIVGEGRGESPEGLWGGKVRLEGGGWSIKQRSRT